jgi:hypothetical protein
MIALAKAASNLEGTFTALTANVCGKRAVVRMCFKLWGCPWKKKAKRRKEEHVSDHPLSDLSDAGLCTLFRNRLDRVSLSRRTGRGGRL